MNILPDNSISRFKELVHTSASVVIVSHTHPDGDALGCVSAMYSYLTRTLDKNAIVLIGTDTPENLDFILRGVQKTDDVSVMAGCDLIVGLDFNCLSRTDDKFQEALLACRAKKILIDHHPHPDTGQFDLVFSETRISSASELLFWILRKVMGDSLKGLSKAALTAMMCGMTTDTNNFANSVWPSTLDMASQLLAAGVDRDGIVQRIFNSYRSARVRAISYLLDNCLVLKDSYAYMIVSKEIKRKFGIREGELEGLVNIPLTIKRIKVSITLTEDNGFYRVSLRSKRGINVNRLATVSFHGGGHEQASGGKLFLESDITSARDIPAYVEECTARFLQATAKRI